MWQTSNVSRNNSEDFISGYESGKTEDEFWTSIIDYRVGEVKDLTVIDFGVGESTKKLANLGAKVIAVDRDIEKLKKYHNLGIPSIKCDITDLPFQDRVADLAVFYFTLHEINPLKHKEVILTVSKVSSKIVVVEPSPEGCPAYRRYAELWRRAMHSIGRFEDYQPTSYWKELIESCGFEITVSKRVKQASDIPCEVLEEMELRIIQEWRKISVESKYIKEMADFLEATKKNGMTWSDLIAIIGESD